MNSNSTPPSGPPGQWMRWHGSTQKHVDTIVFVHGLLGHHTRTWGKFPKLLAEDDDLPELDILMWGYRTGFFAGHNELHLEGGHLVTSLESLIRNGNDIVLVGHSMGGLVILKGLVDRMCGKAARRPPCLSVTWIALFAVPLTGVWLAGLLRRWFALPLRLFAAPHKHLHALANGKGQFVDELMREVRRRIYEPTLEDDCSRKIPMRVIAATRDRAVDKADRDLALVPYTNPAAHQLDETHRSVKLPPHRNDLRYKVLAVDLQEAIRQNFKRLARAAIDPANTELDRRLALLEMNKRYGKIIRRRIRDRECPPELRHQAENQVLLQVAYYGASYDLPPYVLVDLAVNALALRRSRWRRFRPR